MAGLKLTLALVVCALSSVAAITDTDLLIFALNLECLEAQFYSYAAYGRSITPKQRGFGPLPVGGQRAKLSKGMLAVAKDIANDEVSHVDFLRAALGKAAVPCPLIDLNSAFAAAADAAVGQTLNPPFNPYGSDVVFLHGAFIFEDVGVTAYRGAIGALSSKALASYAAGIGSVEAYHAGIIRTHIYQIADNYVFPYGVQVSTIIDAISVLRGNSSYDQGILLNKKLNLVPADKSALVFERTPGQTLKVTFLGGKTKGGFFPNGVNGKINTASD